MDSSPGPALFKTLAHPKRVALLQRLMAGPATLSQLGESFETTPAHIRHHLVVLEEAGLVEFTGARPVQGGSEKYFQATAQALFIHRAILADTPRGRMSLTIGSMDAGIRLLAEQVRRKTEDIHLQPVPLSSLDGLIALRQGLCQMSACHLIDPQTESYNLPFVQRLFPGQSMTLVRVYQREEGLMVRAGNPLNIRSLEDLVLPGLVFINREPGSGVRQWLDLNLKRLGIPPEAISGCRSVARSHAEVARSIREGAADTGIGIAAYARQSGLDFIPLFEEPYEIAMPSELPAETRYAPFFDYLTSGDCRSQLRALDGYHVSQDSGQTRVIQ